MASAGGSLEAGDVSVRTSIVPPGPCPPPADTPDTSPAAMKQQLTASFHDFAVSLAWDETREAGAEAEAAGRRFWRAARAWDAERGRGTLGCRPRGHIRVSPGGHLSRLVRPFGLVVATYSGPACGRHVTFAMHNYVPGARSSA